MFGASLTVWQDPSLTNVLICVHLRKKILAQSQPMA